MPSSPTGSCGSGRETPARADLRRRLKEAGAGDTGSRGEASALAVERFRFVPRLIRLPVIRGWVVLLDEVELMAGTHCCNGEVPPRRWPGGCAATATTRRGRSCACSATVDDFEAQVLVGQERRGADPEAAAHEGTEECGAGRGGRREAGMRVMERDQVRLHPDRDELDRTYPS